MKPMPGLASVALHDDAVEAGLPSTNSQDSSLVEANASQRSQLESSTGNPETLASGIRHGETTPSSSLSNNSVQSDLVNVGSANGTHDIHRERIASQFSTATSSDMRLESSNVKHPGGIKRTATGEIKSPFAGSLPTSPVDSQRYSHSRNTSTASRGSNIGEISSKLQARLSYAKVKIQNGWEHHSISELERMASVHGSPAPLSASALRGDKTSPASYSPVAHTVTTRDQHMAFSNGPLEYDLASSPTRSAVRASTSFAQNITAPGTAVVTIARPNETYEQFWQSHSNYTNPPMRRSNYPSLNVPSLAPPVEFSSRPSTIGHQQQSPPHSHQKFPGHLPSTPPQRLTTLPKVRTPSQQAAVEQDALEGLLSMNSPANSQSQAPPTRATFRSPLQDQAAGPAVVLNGIINGTSRQYSGPVHLNRAPRELNDDEINKMLDEMPESSSSGDDDDLIECSMAPSVVGS